MRFTLIAVLWLAPSFALAQTTSPSDLFGPANPQMKGPPTTYQSVFGKEPPSPPEAPWRAANDEVRRLGGHVGSLRESEDTPAAGMPAAGTPAAGTPAASPAGHDMPGAANAAPSQRIHTHDHK